MVIHRDSHLDSMQEWETSELLNPKRDVFILTSPLKSQEFIEKRSGETIKARDSRWFKKTAFSKHSTEDKHMNSLILWQLIQDPHKLKSDELPEWRRGHGHKAPLLATTLLPTDSFWERENRFSSLKSHWVYSQATASPVINSCSIQNNVCVLCLVGGGLICFCF